MYVIDMKYFTRELKRKVTLNQTDNLTGLDVILSVIRN